MIIVIDNVDSFVHNLARYIREAGKETIVLRNNETTVEDCLALNPEGVVISPGPKKPTDAGISMELILELPRRAPLLGVCLGHQCLVEAFGGETVRAKKPLHGEASDIRHNESGIFKGIASPTPGGRYHSLSSILPVNSPLEATAWSPEGEVMAVAHKTRPWFGVQFHPESILTPAGRTMIENFLHYCDDGAIE